MNDETERTPDASDVSEHLRRTENAVRDLIARELESRIGIDWIEKSGVTAERIIKWNASREIERKKFTSGNLETRLIYFAEFYDLRTILMAHWDQVFGAILHDKNRVVVFLSVLEDFRNPQAHARGLLPYQKHLAVGICGELRAMITRHRSKKETTEDCFPRIDSAYDNHGQTSPDEWSSKRPALRVGDRIEIVVEASDPEELLLEYRFFVVPGGGMTDEQDWSFDNTFSLELREDHISKHVGVYCNIRSPRNFHADGEKDDSVGFSYTVLPARNQS